jgi:class 3 adenylate cyclase
MSLKGQMVVDEHRGIAFFFGSPIVGSGAAIRDLHLTLSEFPIVDSSIDSFVLQQQRFINKKLETLVLERTRELEEERKKTERLLHAILPSHIVPRLKEGRAVIAEQLDQVTVLFLDLVGFTELTTRHSGAMIVKILNEIFQRFDLLLEATDVEKIKTIGDAYMCVGGLSGRAPRQAAERVALVALQMRDIVATPIEGVQLQARIGLHSGPAIAGVIGTSKFAYDLWGDTVNTAARMESHGAPGRIHCSQAAYELLQGNFEFEDRGEVDVRGKGPMHTWFLTGEKGAEPGEPRPGARPGEIAG